jgi:hypothetical protein
MYCDFHEWIAMISMINKLFKLSFRRNTVRTVIIDVTIMELSWSQQARNIILKFVWASFDMFNFVEIVITQWYEAPCGN